MAEGDRTATVGGQFQEGEFRGVPLRLGRSAPGQFGVGARRGGSHHEVGVRRRDLWVRGALGGPEGGDAHVVLGQGPGLVGADHRRRAECLHRAESLDDSAAPGQLPDAYGQCQGDGGQQPLGHVGHQQADREADRRAPAQSGQQTQRQEADPHPNGDRRDQPGDPFHLVFQRAVLPLHARGEGGDAAQFGVHPRRGDHREGLSPGAHRPAEQDVARLEEGNVGVHRLGGAGDRLGLPGEGGDVDLHRTAEQPGVGADAVALGDDHHITRNQSHGLHLSRVTVPHCPGVGGKEGRECFYGPLRLYLLEEREARVQHDHRRDRHRQGRTAADPRQNRGHREDQGQRVGELPREFGRPPGAATADQFVRPVDLRPPRRLPLRQPPGGTAQMLQQ